MNTKAYAVHSQHDKLVPFGINRRDIREDDLLIDIMYCGICHSDIHMTRNDWGISMYPLVPGHEIIGHVTDIGKNVKNFKIGELVGVGCIVDSCRKCSKCKKNLEQYCEYMTMTYSSPDNISGGVTYGGYSQKIIVDKKYVLHVSEKLDKKAVAPLLCAGITTYSPLRKWGVKAGDKVGIIGLGGLGHIAVKLASSMGAHVIMITTSQEKGKDAQKLGADEVLISSNKKQMLQHSNSFDFLLNTIPIPHDINQYIKLMKNNTTMAVVGVMLNALENIDNEEITKRHQTVTNSIIGGIKETQEMLDFCAKHGITADVEMINIQDVNEAYERILKADVKYRFVIDMKSLK